MKYLLFLFCPLFAIGQKNCTGLIVDKITGKGIPYASVGLMIENKGVSADEQGIFSINSYYPKTDSFRITSVGYKTEVLPVAEWVNGKKIELREQEGALQGIVISANKHKKATVLNQFGHCSSNWHWIGLHTIYQRAQQFDATEEGMQLTGLEMCKDPSESVFRFRIYEVDSVTQSPSTELTDTVIEVKSKEKHVRINLEDYAIFIPGKSFFVAVEWLFIPFNEDEQTSKNNRKKIKTIYYKPAMRSTSARNGKPNNVWELNFRGRWSPSHSSRQGDNYQITATLR